MSGDATDAGADRQNSADPGSAEVPWRRLSPRMLSVQPALELIRAIPGLIGLLVLGASSGNGPLFVLVGSGLVIVHGLLRWATTTYRITADQVQLREGVLRRRSISVARDRVRTVDVTASAMHRLVGLARVTVGTGRSDRREDGGLTLDALDAPAAALLRDELLHRAPAANATMAPAAAATEAPSAAPPAEQELARLDPRWIRYGPFTLMGVVAVGVVAGLLARLVSEAHVDPARVGPLRALARELMRAPLGLAIAEVAVAGAILVAIASTVGYVLAFWGFCLTRHPGGTLHVSRGLITTRATSIEERRLHGVELSEPLSLRAAGGARCIAIATGLRVGRGAERGGSLLLPPAPRAAAERVAAAVLHDEEPITGALRAHGPQARRRRFTRALAGATAIVAALAALWAVADWPAWTWLASLALLPASALLAADRFRSLGHALVDGTLVTRRGSLLRRHSALACDGIIGWNLRSSFFQRRAGLVTLEATTAAGRQRYVVQDVAAAAALGLADAATPGLLTPFLATDGSTPTT